MPPGDDEAEVGRDCVFFKEGREKMAFHVINPEKGFGRSGREAFCVSEADEKG